MRLIARSNVVLYAQRHAGAAAALQHWLELVKASDWRGPADVQATFSKVKMLRHSRARFEIGGGGHRLVAAISYEAGVVFVKFIGTHVEYDRVDVETVNLFGPERLR